MIEKTFERFDQEWGRAEITMTPLIDMVFILLIFFVVTTTFSRETGIIVHRARATTAEAVRNKLLLVAIDREGRYWCEEKHLSEHEAVAHILRRLQESTELTVVLVPDKDSRVEPLVTIIDRLRANDVTRFTLGTRKEPQKSET